MRKSIVFSCLVFALFCTQVAQAHIERFRVFEMNGELENPDVVTDGFGSGLVTFDLDLVTMRVQASFGGLTGNTTNAHIHCCNTFPTNSIVATRSPTFLNWPEGVKSGTYDHTYDMTLSSSYNGPFITNNGGTIASALEALLNGARAGNKAYLNIHSTHASGGEIRGYLIPVPEPNTFMLVLLGMAGIVARRRHR
jgi:hypothetical protein